MTPKGSDTVGRGNAPTRIVLEQPNPKEVTSCQSRRSLRHIQLLQGWHGTEPASSRAMPSIGNIIPLRGKLVIQHDQSQFQDFRCQVWLMTPEGSDTIGRGNAPIQNQSGYPLTLKG